MSKTLFNHCIINDKGTEYVLFKDYIKLQNKLLNINDYADFISRCTFDDKHVDLFVKDLMKNIKNMVTGSDKE